MEDELTPERPDFWRRKVKNGSGQEPAESHKQTARDALSPRTKAIANVDAKQSGGDKKKQKRKEKLQNQRTY